MRPNWHHGIFYKTIQGCGAAVVAGILQVKLFQCSFKPNVDTASCIYQDAVNQTISNLYRDHHWIIMRLNYVVCILFCEDDLGRTRIVLGSPGDPEYIMTNSKPRDLPSMVLP